jgi:CYTH domain-containing protein
MSDTEAKKQSKSILEIERKFVVDQPPDSESLSRSTSIEQGYLAVDADGTEVRIRRKGDRCSQTIKKGEGLSRLESEITLSSDQFDALWPLTGGHRLEKVRFEIPFGGLVIELDVFKGDLEGLIVAEVEFESVEQSGRFEPPDWFGKEVTEDTRYKNRNLALYGRP